MKVFNVSLYRSATQSFSLFLNKHGLRGIHWFGIEFDYRCRTALGKLNTGEIWRRVLPTVRNNDHFSDLPFPFLLREAAEAFPDAKFLIISRAPQDWVKSVRRHVRNRELTIFEKFLYWDFCKDKHNKLWEYTDAELAEVYTAHLQFCHDLAGKMSIDFKVFNLDMPELGKGIAEFIGFPPKMEFPRYDYLPPVGRTDLSPVRK